jgi:hypothetical protein
LPARLVGAWARESIAVGGDEPSEPQVVRYLQAGRAYADLRLDLAGAEDAAVDGVGAGPHAICFAGTTTWEAPWATWHHDIDLDRDLDLDTAASQDRGEIEWLAGGRMAERGTFPSPVGPLDYIEVWRALPVGEGGVLVLRSTTVPACLVQIGVHALVVCDRRHAGGGFAARYDQRRDGAWHARLALGDTTDLPTPPPDRPATGGLIDLAGLEWLVDESSPTLNHPSLPTPAVTP